MNEAWQHALDDQIEAARAEAEALLVDGASLSASAVPRWALNIQETWPAERLSAATTRFCPHTAAPGVLVVTSWSDWVLCPACARLDVPVRPGHVWRCDECGRTDVGLAEVLASAGVLILGGRLCEQCYPRL